MVCRFCGKRSDFVDSHVIPRSFFAPLKAGSNPPLLVTDRVGVLPKRSPIGEYDKEILCKECEPKFGEWDSYGKTVLVDLIKTATLIHESGELVAYRLSGVDIPKFRMFFISVLWRASVSMLEFSRLIKLGPFDAKARALIEARNPGGVNEFSVILSKWDNDWVPLTSNPYMIKMDGVNTAVLEMMDYKAYIKVDKRPVPNDMIQYALGAESDICIFSRRFADSRERRVIANLAPNFWK